MKSRVITILGLACASLLLSSCGTDNVNNNRIVKNFEKDSYTQKVSSVTTGNEDVTSKPENEEHSGGYSETLSEITLIGQDNSKTYDIIDNSDIKYREVVYKNLYTNIQSIDTNYDKNTLINFLIKTHESKSSLIYTVLTTNVGDGIDGEIETITFDDMLSGVDKYEEAKHKYGEEVCWMLQFIDSKSRHEVQIFGAKSYIIITANGVSSEIDMTKYDSSISSHNAGDVNSEASDNE